MAIGQASLALLLILTQRDTRAWRWPLSLFLIALIAVELDTPLSSLCPNIGEQYWVFALIPLCLICPALWLYISALTTRDALGPYRTYWPHALPSLFALFIFVVFISLSPSARETLNYDGPPAPFDREAFVAMCLLFLGLIWMAQVIFYVIFSLKKLSRHRQDLRHQYANLSGRELWWMTWLSWLLFCYAIFSIIYLFLGDENAIANQIDGLFTFVTTGIVAFLGLRQDPIYEYAVVDVTKAVESEASSKPAMPRKKYQKSALTTEMSERLVAKIEKEMQSGYYKNPNLSLDMLAQKVGAAPNYISQTLNETLATTFFDYINSWRAKDVMANIDASNTSFTTLAHDAGFNSRSAFYRAFKRETGQTPGQYRKTRSFRASQD